MYLDVQGSILNEDKKHFGNLWIGRIFCGEKEGKTSFHIQRLVNNMRNKKSTVHGQTVISMLNQ